VFGKLAAEQPVERCAHAAEGEVALGNMVKQEEVVDEPRIGVGGWPIGRSLAGGQPLPRVKHGLCVRMSL
jgi:hypothetical protein